ncbi:hypothetical protein GSI_08720 [Ganoderma sinense ZZ0214-1]|uniref:Uncharacterized protein n=1 Tax=Ganoderma sinense ZZ0214-1 TaxID=1077348 RepID=A0A2G8S4H2_9APHY|nr:hypothetical protein GSI_08720 [Ganoderma sinense ZZ0214-1]
MRASLSVQPGGSANPLILPNRERRCRCRCIARCMYVCSVCNTTLRRLQTTLNDGGDSGKRGGGCEGSDTNEIIQYGGREGDGPKGYCTWAAAWQPPMRRGSKCGDIYLKGPDAKIEKPHATIIGEDDDEGDPGIRMQVMTGG